VAAVRELLGITDANYSRWRKEYGGMKVDQAKRLKALEQESARLNGEFSYTAAEARVLIERWREHYTRVRLHSALEYRLPAREAIAAGPPPLRSWPSSRSFRIRRLLRNLWTQQRAKVSATQSPASGPIVGTQVSLQSRRARDFGPK
jgi:hypothetical protein